ncbi:MAG: PleD family two-component system response regulator [Sphingobacterium hotanense]
MKILIIDDDHRNIFALKMALKSRGLHAFGCLDAREGLELLKQDSDFDVVLLDMMMPECDGFEVLEIIRNDSVDEYPPVISVTAKAMKGDRERCLMAGADGYVAKPVDIDILLKEIDGVTSKRKQ